MKEVTSIFFLFLLSCKAITYKKTDDFIIKCPERFRDEVKLDIEDARKKWKHTENPIVAFYRGNDIGDYFHLNFQDVNGKEYDFGLGNNDYGKYVLHKKSGNYNDNPKYLNKKFIIHWKWKKSSFPCCSGEHETVKAYIPSITKLQLVQ